MNSYFPLHTVGMHGELIIRLIGTFLRNKLMEEYCGKYSIILHYLRSSRVSEEDRERHQKSNLLYWTTKIVEIRTVTWLLVCQKR